MHADHPSKSPLAHRFVAARGLFAHRRGRYWRWAWLGSAHAQNTNLSPSANNANAAAPDNGVSGPTRLRQPTAELPAANAAVRPTDGAESRNDVRGVGGATGAPPQLSEFEEYVNSLAFPQGTVPGQPIRRLGSALMTDVNRPGDAIDFSPLVPPDYLVSPGDEIVLSIWGSVDAELRLVVDRSGRISIPRVGTIMVSGVRYADLPATISQRVAQTFKNFQLSVSLGQLRGVRVYVTGFVARPGGYTVNALSSMASALVRAGGPSVSGSFRDIELRRGSGLVSTLDFYDLLLKGNRSSDRLVQADDVIHVGPIGSQVGVIGSVNRAAIFELKPERDDGRRAAHGRRLLGRGRHHAPVARARRRTIHLARHADRSRTTGHHRVAQRATCCAPSTPSRWRRRSNARTSACVSKARCCVLATTCCRR